MRTAAIFAALVLVSVVTGTTADVGLGGRGGADSAGGGRRGGRGGRGAAPVAWVIESEEYVQLLRQQIATPCVASPGR